MEAVASELHCDSLEGDPIPEQTFFMWFTRCCSDGGGGWCLLQYRKYVQYMYNLVPFGFAQGKFSPSETWIKCLIDHK